MGSSGTDQLKQLRQLKGRRTNGVFKPQAGARMEGSPAVESDPKVVAQYKALAERSRKRRRIVTFVVLLSIGALFGGVMYWFGHTSM
ncbi:hypothetical protein [Phaeocystidibacter luteus]|uniref:Uncharacterized protein n=1 Tax=Phaeocystidibacter luteus TaxID=911197 RepID=A0A6N6RGC9_9FLAO|nr:hypothetical protein [Phaeocystidibacter luteus]KAB2809798.1 hypothetical protein F8C67_09590 [Phaeocystidibacter luteus]